MSTAAMASTTDMEKIRVRVNIRNTIRFMKQYLLPLGQDEYTKNEIECHRRGGTPKCAENSYHLSVKSK
jgi:hypothetical protein